MKCWIPQHENNIYGGQRLVLVSRTLLFRRNLFDKSCFLKMERHQPYKYPIPIIMMARQSFVASIRSDTSIIVRNWKITENPFSICHWPMFENSRQGGLPFKPTGRLPLFVAPKTERRCRNITPSSIKNAWYVQV